MKRLTNKDPRCSGLYRLGYTEACLRRDTCLRYLSFTRLDRAAGIEHYRGIPVVMAVKDCKIFLEAE
jgi:hypothetical protein